MAEQLPAGVTAWDSAIWQTRSVLVRGARGLVLFDPTYFPREIEAIAETTDREPSGGERTLVFTHSDWDHVVGFPRFSNWRTVAHQAVAEKTTEQQRKILDEIESFDGKWYVDRPRPVYPRIDHAVTNEETGKLAGEEVLFVPTPGHTDDGIATIFVNRKLMVAGDVLSALEFPFVYYSVAEYRRTLDVLAERVRSLDISCLIPGHGPAAASRAEIEGRLTADRDYLAQLVDRVAICATRGVRGSELQQELTSFAYRGKPIGRHQLDFHLANITIAEREHLAEV